MKRASGESETERRTRYAAKDVTDKLGIKSAQAVRVVGGGDDALLAQVRAKTGRALVDGRTHAEVVLYWARSADEVTATLTRLKQALVPSGGIWVISAKKNKGEPYLPDAVLIPLGLAAGLVDNKICSISETHTAMRFVIRRADR